MSNGATTIPASGSQPVRLATPATAESVLIYALSANAGPIYLGGSSVTSSTAPPIPAGGYASIEAGDIGSIYVAGTEADSVVWSAAGRTLPA